MTADGSERDLEVLAQFERAYTEFGGGLLRFASRLCGNREDAEDIVVESFTQAFLKWGSFRGSGSRRSWLYGIAINRYRRHRRIRRLHPEVPEEEVLANTTDILDWIALNQGIARLPPRRREAFLLVKGEGLTCREAAEALDRPLGTILSDVHEAMLALRVTLRGEGDVHTGDGRLCEVEQ